jgi:thiosulfate dehydrogenase [quinone] large subunit
VVPPAGLTPPPIPEEFVSTVLNPPVPEAASHRSGPVQESITTPAAVEGGPSRTAKYLLAVTRLSLGWVFLWPFLDKLFGLGHETASAKAWIHGGSPTKGFLSGAEGPFAGFYHSFAGAQWANWGFMLGLLGIAVGLLLGIGMRIVCAGGAVLVVLMWSASLPPTNDVFMDDHLIYALVLITLAVLSAGDTLGLGRQWKKTALVRRFGWLA